MAPDDLGLRIKRARERLGWNQQDLADALTRQRGGRKVGVRSVGRWERGQSAPRYTGALEVVLRTDLTSATAPDPVEDGIRGLRDLPPQIAEKLIALYRELTGPGAQPSANGGRPHSSTG